MATVGRGQVPFHRFTTAQGLSQSTITQIIQDRQGFLWLGTADGLNRYDGYGFTTYRHHRRDSTSLPASDVWVLAEDAQDRLWVGTYTGGVCYLDRQTEHFVRVPLRAGGRTITGVSALLAQQEGVWVGTPGAGLFFVDKHTLRAKLLSGAESPMAEPNVTALGAGRQSTCWVGTQGGTFYHVAQDPFRVLQYGRLPGPASGNRIVAFYEAPDQTLWIGTEARGLYQLQPGERQPRQVFYQPGKRGGLNSITSFARDTRQTLWIGTDDGLLRVPQGDLSRAVHQPAQPDQEQGLSSHAVKSLLTDRSGNVWVGTWEGGLNVAYHEAEHFRTLTRKDGLPERKVTAIGGDRSGGVWLGSSAGLTYWTPSAKRFERVVPPHIPGRDVYLLSHFPADRPLAGTWNQPFAVWNPPTRRFVSQPGNASAAITSATNFAQAFAPADSNRIWVSTRSDGILRFDPITLRSDPLPDVIDGVNLKTMGAKAMCQTSDGTLWLGTYSDGLWALNLRTRRIRHYLSDDRPGSLAQDHINALFEDAQHRLWVGTNGGGLNRFDRRTGRFVTYTTENGLANNTVKSILQDKRGMLWIATNDGLSRFDPERDIFTSYSTCDGLSGREFMTNASYRSPDGHLFFGSTEGLTYFHPDSVPVTRNRLPVLLTGLRLFNRPVAVGSADSPLKQPLTQTKELTLRHGQSVFTLDFLVLNFRNASKAQYAYRLDPLDPDWNYVGTQRSATYTNLDPGDYTFRVKAVNGFGADETTLTIRVLPPWYRTGWAYAGYALLVLLALWAIRHGVRVRERFRYELRAQTLEAQKIRELDELKTNFFTNISHEFRTAITLIISPLERLITKETGMPTEQVQQQHRLIHRNAQRLLRLINQLLDLSKLEAGQMRPRLSRNTLPDFVERIVATFQPLSVTHRIMYQSSFPNVPVWYDPDLLENVLSNLLSNALKFTPEGGEIDVTLTPADTAHPPQQAVLTVRDTGTGIAPEHLSHIFQRFYQIDGRNQSKTVGTGVGLALCRELIELVGGQIDVASEVGRGSCFTVRLPLTPPTLEENAVGPTLERLPVDMLVVSQTNVPTPAPGGQPQGSLLLVEDNDELRAYIRSVFAEQYVVWEAANGEDGWQLVLDRHPDLIISDLMMPKLNGLDLCRRLKQHPATSHIPVILLTARQNADSQLKGLSVGADDYLAKPFNEQMLLNRVQNLLRTRQHLRERFGRVVTVQPSELTTTSADEQFLTQALRLIEARIDDPDLSVHDLEEALNLSETLLYRKLKTLTGLSGVEFIRSVRLKRAAQWLRSDADVSVSEVAYRVGFRDPAYFSRCFAKEFGQSPKQFAATSAPVG
ncbi:hypothetical protein AWR27_17885 [Spirosoma montaniterrae]|uniref:histidine kinase n=1 Tax=Spirosoma montaniterrae TaxID=1178516 RepID=A0A1P9X068_9BACT|nr:hypothetical protein AWR27_17885 [Spirosoma montaniterrae]